MATYQLATGELVDATSSLVGQAMLPSGSVVDYVGEAFDSTGWQRITKELQENSERNLTNYPVRVTIQKTRNFKSVISSLSFSGTCLQVGTAGATDDEAIGAGPIYVSAAGNYYMFYGGSADPVNNPEGYPWRVHLAHAAPSALPSFTKDGIVTACAPPGGVSDVYPDSIYYDPDYNSGAGRWYLFVGYYLTGTYYYHNENSIEEHYYYADTEANFIAGTLTYGGKVYDKNTVGATYAVTNGHIIKIGGKFYFTVSVNTGTAGQFNIGIFGSTATSGTSLQSCINNISWDASVTTIIDAANYTGAEDWDLGYGCFDTNPFLYGSQLCLIFGANSANSTRYEYRVAIANDPTLPKGTWTVAEDGLDSHYPYNVEGRTAIAFNADQSSFQLFCDYKDASGNTVVGSYEFSSTNVVYVYGFCRDDFNNIQFTDSDGTTKLSFFKESYVSGQYATFWVKIPSLTSLGSVNIGVYYDGSVTTDQSEPGSVFSYWDGFDDSAVGADWSVTGTVSESGTLATVGAASSGAVHALTSITAYSPQYSFLMGGYRNSSNTPINYAQLIDGSANVIVDLNYASSHTEKRIYQTVEAANTLAIELPRTDSYQRTYEVGLTNQYDGRWDILSSLYSVLDSFTGTNGTKLVGTGAHTGTYGYTKATSFTESSTIQSNTLHGPTTAQTEYYYVSHVFAGYDLDVAFTITPLGTDVGAASITVWQSTTAGTCYEFGYYPSVNAFRIYKRVTGTGTQIGSDIDVSAWRSFGTPINVRGKIRGITSSVTLTLIIDEGGAHEASTTGTSTTGVTNIARVGIRTQTNSTYSPNNTAALDLFYINDVPAQPLAITHINNRQVATVAKTATAATTFKPRIYTDNTATAAKVIADFAALRPLVYPEPSWLADTIAMFLTSSNPTSTTVDLSYDATLLTFDHYVICYSASSPVLITDNPVSNGTALTKTLTIASGTNYITVFAVDSGGIPVDQSNTITVTMSGGVVTTITVTDGIVFLDPTSLTNDVSQYESLLLGSNVGVDQTKILLDYLFVADSYATVIDRLLVDFLYAYDSATQSGGGVVTETTVIDYLAMIDSYIKDNQTQVTDSMFLSDIAFSDAFKLLVDTMLVSDSNITERQVTMLDGILIDTLHSRIQEILRQELLFVSDSITAARISATAALLSFARLDRNAYLGISLKARSWLEERVAINDYLGISLSHDRWRVS